MYTMLKAALMVSFPSRDKEWLFTTANTPVSEEDKCHTCEGLSGTNLFLNDTFNLEGVRGIQGDLKQQRGKMTEYTFRRFHDHTYTRANMFAMLWLSPRHRT